MSTPAPPRRGPGFHAKRILLLAGIALAAINIWTGGPLFALWVGSRTVQDGGQPTMGSVFLVIAVLAGVCIGLVVALSRMSAAYDDLVGRRAQRRQVPWLRSMRGERSHARSDETRPSAPDVLIIAVVVLGVIAFEVWFFFFSGSPI